MVTAEEAQKITEMRELLGTLEERCREQFIAEAVNPSGVNLYNLGRFVATIEGAETALFRILNVGNAYLHIDVCGEAIEASLVAS